VHRFVVNGMRDDVVQMRENLVYDPTAVQTMGLAHLTTYARLRVLIRRVMGLRCARF
jgi:hypothetical protein